MTGELDPVDDQFTAGYNAGYDAAQNDFDLKIRSIANQRYTQGVLDGREMAGKHGRRWHWGRRVC